MNNSKDFIYESKHILKVDEKCKEKAFEFCEGYKKFIDESKTERECVKNIEEIAKNAGYTEFKVNKKLKAGEKVYVNNRGKSIVLITVGSEKIENGVNFVISHIDAPRLDLKINPVIENESISYFKTHYYGGIKKYQWPITPLSMHGRIFKEDGSFVDICYGEKDDEPKFMISDILPHLSQEQDKKTMKEGIKAEDLNIIIGSLPLIEDEELKEAVKINTLKILNEMYGITEKDFLRAEIEFVPANKSCDIGFDKSIIAAYGHDDRVCAYPALMSEIENVNPSRTSVTVFTDKEEIGSEGNTGMVSNYLFDIMEDVADCLGAKTRLIYRNSMCLSSDVNAAYDPSFSDPFDIRNASQINRGISINKFTGHGGKYDANDASAETVAKVISLLDTRDVVWQACEFGKVDVGGGGTIAKYVSQRNIDTVDIGVPVLAMHSPYEMVSKLDVYHTYLGYKAFLLNKSK